MNGRSHEPSFRELVVELDGFRALMEERDRRYTDAFQASKEAVDKALAAAKEAVASALVAAEKLTSSAFASSEKAIAEAKGAQKDVNDKSNEFRGQLKDQNDTMIPRPEAGALFRAIEEKIDETRKGIFMLREAAASYPSRNEVNTMLGSIVKDVTELRESRSYGSGALWAIGAGIAFGLTVLGIILKYARS